MFLPFVGIAAGGISASGGISVAGISKHWKRIMLLHYSVIYFYVIYYLFLYLEHADNYIQRNIL